MMKKLFQNLRIRHKLLLVVLPLVIIPILAVGGIVSYTSANLARDGVNRASRADMEHMAIFTRHLLEAHYRQFQVYQRQRQRDFIRELKNLARTAADIVATEDKLYRQGKTSLKMAQQRAGKMLKMINIGASGYVYALTSDGTLRVHVAQEGENIINRQDGNGRFFIREMIDSAVKAKPGSIGVISYPWRNPMLGDKRYRHKTAAYIYFPAWDWVIAASAYTAESYSDTRYEKQALADLKRKIKRKRVGESGYIFCMDSKGTFTIHPEGEGKNFYDIRDNDGKAFIKEMCEHKRGWIRYPWRNKGENRARMKIVRYEYFKPWDWIVAVGCYEDEFYQAANAITATSFKITLLVTVLVAVIAIMLLGIAARVLTNPIQHMISVIRRVKSGHQHEQIHINSNDELGELAQTFNHMTTIISENQEMENRLAQHGKMASLGVLSSGVAHEINNPLGVILGYAGYLESKIPADDPCHNYVSEIKRESKRCRKIVQDLLSYARTPKSVLEPADINVVLRQIVDFATNHTDMRNVVITTDFANDLPQMQIDSDQIRQVAINLILNAGAAMEDGGELMVTTERHDNNVVISFSDNGCGIPDERLEKIFEPFYTTKARGTGLGLAISRQIIEQHHGSITIESNVGSGTCVRVCLPIDQQDFNI